MFDEKESPLDVLGTILGDGKSSRLYRSLVYDKQIARDVSVGHYAQELAGEFQIQVTASPGHTLEEVQDVVEEELARIRRDPPTDQELARSGTASKVNTSASSNGSEGSVGGRTSSTITT